MRSSWPLALFVALAALAGVASADDAPDEDTRPRERSALFRDIRFILHGYLRVRADVFDDLDLSRGPVGSPGTELEFAL